MLRSAMKPLVFAGILMAAPAAQAQWHDRGHGWGHGGYGHHHYRGYSGGGMALGALLGLGAGVAIGTALAPPAYYAPPPGYYSTPQGYYGAPPSSWGGGRQVYTPHVPPAPPSYNPGFGGGYRK